MNDSAQPLDDVSYLAQCLNAVQSVLARDSMALPPPILSGRSVMDCVAVLTPATAPDRSQLCLYLGVNAATRRRAVAQAVAALVVLVREPGHPNPFAAARWGKVMEFLKQDPGAPVQVQIGPPPPILTPATPAAAPKKTAATGLTVDWLPPEGARALPITDRLLPKGPLSDSDATESAARMISALLDPRGRAWWGRAGSGGLVAVVDPDQLRMKTAFLDAVADRAPCGVGELELRRCIRTMMRPRDHLVGDALLMLGCPPGSSQVQLVAAAGAWRLARRVRDQIQYEVSLEFMWASPSQRGAYRKAMSSVLGLALAEELAVVCADANRLAKAFSVVSRIHGRSELEQEGVAMAAAADEFKRRCKKSRGGVAYGGLDLKLIRPRLFE
ncbi:hypothetical protein E4T66_17620 [Sinimarinibacterium sp. CAU 1509]|uniref:hypothetical protein n=1 Tax=Sinimarinibacterium sp. CAU 1509 TaxID=2562283 RepID=UPI0010AD1B89|nr:hypothetical protein [Sinimarinibacterium sp. CAU 1509]TJY57227.1 hypothetical protein E4T66_17620 [Sinimarinibacterium sp. CAU 1509]